MANLLTKDGRMLTLVIEGLSHSVNLGLTFLQEYELKLECTLEEGANLTPVRGQSL